MLVMHRDLLLGLVVSVPRRLGAKPQFDLIFGDSQSGRGGWFERVIGSGKYCSGRSAMDALLSGEPDLGHKCDSGCSIERRRKVNRMRLDNRFFDVPGQWFEYDWH